MNGSGAATVLLLSSSGTILSAVGSIPAPWTYVVKCCNLCGCSDTSIVAEAHFQYILLKLTEQL